MPRRHLTGLLTLCLTAAAGPAFAQIGPATTQPPGAEDPRFGLLANDEGYYGATRYSDSYGELLELSDDGSMLLKMSGLADEDGIEDADLGEKRIEFENPDQARVYLNGALVSPVELQAGDRLSVLRDPDGRVRRVNALRAGDFEDDDLRAPARDPRRRNPVDEEADPDELAPATTPDALGQRFSPEEKREYLDRIPGPEERNDGEGGFADITVESRGGDDRPSERSGGKPMADTPADGNRGFEGGGETYGMGMLISDNPGPGVMVADVSPDGPAEEAGIHQGDFLMAVNGADIETPEDLDERATQAPRDKPVTFSVWRDGATEAVEVTPKKGARNEVSKSNRQAMGRSPRSGYLDKLGAKVRDSEQGGVEVTEAAFIGSLAAEAADGDDRQRQRRRYLYPGDRIVGFNGTPVNNRGFLTRQMQGYSGTAYPLQVVRGGRRLNVPFPVGANIMGNIGAGFAF